MSGVCPCSAPVVSHYDQPTCIDAYCSAFSCACECIFWRTSHVFVSSCFFLVAPIKRWPQSVLLQRVLATTLAHHPFPGSLKHDRLAYFFPSLASSPPSASRRLIMNLRGAAEVSVPQQQSSEVWPLNSKHFTLRAFLILHLLPRKRPLWAVRRRGIPRHFSTFPLWPFYRAACRRNRPETRGRWDDIQQPSRCRIFLWYCEQCLFFTASQNVMREKKKKKDNILGRGQKNIYMKVDNNVFNLGGIDSNHRHRSQPAVLLISVQSRIFQVGSTCACRFCHIEAVTAPHDNNTICCWANSGNKKCFHSVQRGCSERVWFSKTHTAQTPSPKGEKKTQFLMGLPLILSSFIHHGYQVVSFL